MELYVWTIWIETYDQVLRFLLKTSIASLFLVKTSLEKLEKLEKYHFKW